MSPLEVATGYAVIANGGYRVEPFLIERIDNLEGGTVYEAQPLTVCRECETPSWSPSSSGAEHGADTGR